MRVLVLSDGVPGHDRSSLGILAALAKHHGVGADMLPVRAKRRFSRRATRLLAALLPFETFWRLFYAVGGDAAPIDRMPVLDRLPDGPIDLVIATGPRIAAANIAIARRLAARNVYFGFPKWPSDRYFTVLLTPDRRATHPHCAYALRPSDIDASDLPEARALVRNGTERRASILFGGQSKHYRYTPADMDLLAGKLIVLAREMPWVRWTFFDSRRSDRGGIDRLSEMVMSSGAPVEFVRFADGGLLSNTIAFRSDLVMVTADSMSMLAEAVASARPTGILFADGYRPPRRDAIEHQAMIADRRAFPIAFSALSADVLLKETARLELLRVSQLEMLYQTLALRGI